MIYICGKRLEMSPIFSCAVTKIAAICVLIGCLMLLTESVTNVAQIAVTVDPEIASRNEAIKEMLKQERIVAEQRLSNMEDIVAQNSDELPERKEVLTANEMCSRRRSCVPKFYPLETHIKVAPAYKLLGCVVHKSMSTVMTAVFCYLFDKGAYKRSGREFISEWSRFRFCRDKNEYNSVPAARKALSLYGVNQTGWSFSMVTRDPVERFISGFVDRCIRKPQDIRPCNGCGYNMTCFLQRELYRIQEQVAAKHLKRTFEDVHFFPQNWRCQLHREYKNFEFLKYSSENTTEFIDNVMQLLERQKVPSDAIEFLREQLSTGKTVHVTAQSPARVFLEKRLRSSPFLLEHIVRMFYHDFILFDYEFPAGF